MTNRKPNPSPEDQRRMMIFFVAAAFVMLGSYFLITKPNVERARIQEAQKQEDVAKQVEFVPPQLVSLDEALTSVPRIGVDTPKLSGSVPTKGLRFDDFLLNDYYTTLEKTDHVRLLSPRDARRSNFVEIGLMPADASVLAPTQNTAWRIVGRPEKLTPETPVTLEWENGRGITYRSHISVDRRYVVTVTDEVENNADESVTLYPYALVSQAHHKPLKGEKIAFEDRDAGIQHIGPIAYLDGKLHEESYGDVEDERMIQYSNVRGWIGITAKYWLTALLPKSEQIFDARFAYQKGDNDADIYQVDLRGTPLIVKAGETSKTEMRFFAGAKKLDILDAYEEELAVEKLELAVDFGVLYVITKPLYHLLSFMGNYIHEEYGFAVSFGIALLILTVLARLAMFPLQNKSYRAMNRMKDMGPKLHALKEKYPDDKVKFQQEVMELYKREKINPAAGCLPILLQIPIFFALYKVIYITIDMRHAPFWGWVHDLSAPDPTNLFNLFGLIPLDLPGFLTLGAWPLLYGITMWAQQELNPKPEDEMQKQIFAMMPWIFMFVFAQFPAGLVIYYTWSNILGIGQQYSLRKLNPGMAPPKKKKKNGKAD